MLRNKMTNNNNNITQHFSLTTTTNLIANKYHTKHIHRILCVSISFLVCVWLPNVDWNLVYRITWNGYMTRSVTLTLYYFERCLFRFIFISWVTRSCKYPNKIKGTYYIRYMGRAKRERKKEKRVRSIDCDWLYGALKFISLDLILRIKCVEQF